MTSNDEVVLPQYIEPILYQSPIQGAGFDERPINWKSQIGSRYLDTCIFKSTSTVGTIVTFGISSTNLTITGRLKWKTGVVSGDAVIYIPVPGTYLITSRINEAIGNTATQMMLKIYDNNAVIQALICSVPITPNVFKFGMGSIVLNLTQGQYIAFSGETNTAGGKMYTETAITKIS